MLGMAAKVFSRTADCIGHPDTTGIHVATGNEGHLIQLAVAQTIQ